MPKKENNIKPSEGLEKLNNNPTTQLYKHPKHKRCVKVHLEAQQKFFQS